MSTRTRFEKEAKGNSEMAYLIDGFKSRDMLAMFVYKRITNYVSCFA